MYKKWILCVWGGEGGEKVAIEEPELPEIWNYKVSVDVTK